MDGNDSSGALGEHGRDRCRIDIAAVSVHIGKNRCRPYIHHGRYRRDEGPGGDHDLVAGANAERLQGQVERKRAVGQRDGVSGTAPCSKFAFKLSAFVARPIVNAV